VRLFLPCLFRSFFLHVFSLSSFVISVIFHYLFMSLFLYLFRYFFLSLFLLVFSYLLMSVFLYVVIYFVQVFFSSFSL